MSLVLILLGSLVLSIVKPNKNTQNMLDVCLHSKLIFVVVVVVVVVVVIVVSLCKNHHPFAVVF